MKNNEINYGLIKCLWGALGYHVKSVKVKDNVATITYRDKKPKKKVAKK